MTSPNLLTPFWNYFKDQYIEVQIELLNILCGFLSALYKMTNTLVVFVQIKEILK
jgi:hypothetical protein